MTAIRVTRESGPYDHDDSPDSWIADLVVATNPDSLITSRSDSTGAAERLSRHAYVVGEQIEKGTEYGRRAEQALTEMVRVSSPDAVKHRQAVQEVRGQVRDSLRDAELRSLVTEGGTTVSASGGGAAAFVEPVILMSAWSEYRSPYRAFADQLTAQTLPASGMNVYVPDVTTGTNVAQLVEGDSVASASPVTGLIASPVEPFAGEVQISQAFLDRAGPGISGDKLVYAQLREQLDAQVDTFAITQALSGAQTVTDNSGAFLVAGTSGVGGLLGDLKKAKSLTRNTAGTRINSTHAFAIGDLNDYVTSWADGQGRPVFSPSSDSSWLPIKSTGDTNPGGAEGYTGYVLNGLALFTDDSIPNQGTTSQLQVIVTRPSMILLLEGAPIFSTYSQATAGNLLPTVNLRSYAAVIPRYPSGVVSISGSAFTASTFA